MFARRKTAKTLSQFCWPLVRGAKSSSRGRRSSKLPVLLSQDVESLGSEGDQIYVEPGHARNWLIPQLMAKYDTTAGHGHRPPKTDQPGPRVKSEDSLAKQFAKMSPEQKQLHQIMHRLQATPVEVMRTLRADGQLSRSLTRAGIVAAIARQKKIALDDSLIQLEQPISSPGTFSVPLAVTLGTGKQATLQVIVGSKEL